MAGEGGVLHIGPYRTVQTAAARGKNEIKNEIVAPEESKRSAGPTDVPVCLCDNDGPRERCHAFIFLFPVLPVPGEGPAPRGFPQIPALHCEHEKGCFPSVTASLPTHPTPALNWCVCVCVCMCVRAYCSEAKRCKHNIVCVCVCVAGCVCSRVCVSMHLGRPVDEVRGWLYRGVKSFCLSVNTSCSGPRCR